MNDAKRYARQPESEDGYYRTPALPLFALHVPTLWQEVLPGPAMVVSAVKEMIKGS
jgi:hypothetical protein